MHRFRDRGMLLLAVVVSVINTIVFIINPQQLNSLIEKQSVRIYLSDSEGIISTSSRSELTAPDQNIPLYEFKNIGKVSVQPAPRFMQLFQVTTPVETELFRRAASGYLTGSARPEMNGVSLFILHHRLNT